MTAREGVTRVVVVLLTAAAAGPALALHAPAGRGGGNLITQRVRTGFPPARKVVA